jgi:hypothetical protein
MSNHEDNLLLRAGWTNNAQYDLSLYRASPYTEKVSYSFENADTYH